jgi:hypothetical protein
LQWRLRPAWRCPRRASAHRSMSFQRSKRPARTMGCHSHSGYRRRMRA